MKIVCRLEDTAGDKNSKWYKELFAKHQDEKYKAQVIATVIKKICVFGDTEVPIYPTLVNKIVKRDWKASDIRNRVALVNAARCLSPFAVVYLT